MFIRINVATQQFHTKGKIRELEANWLGATTGNLSNTTQTQIYFIMSIVTDDLFSTYDFHELWICVANIYGCMSKFPLLQHMIIDGTVPTNDIGQERNNVGVGEVKFRVHARCNYHKARCWQGTIPDLTEHKQARFAFR